MNEELKQQVLMNITFESAKILLGSTSWIENYGSPDAFELTTT